MEDFPETVAAIDLGSNSFHLIVAQVNEQGVLQKVDKLKEMVRLRGGLDKDNNLSPEKEQEALACLRRFGERIRHLPPEAVRIAGTNTLRNMNDSAAFIKKAKKALGHSLSIIGGREEARLVYLGVAHTLSDDKGRRLVIDIGGGSTEFIIGKKFQPEKLESLEMGSVTATQNYFSSGSLAREHWEKANTALSLEITPIKTAYRSGQWEIATGSSGTIKATMNITKALGLQRFGITLYALHEIRERLIQAEHIDNIELPELKTERAPVFPGGLAVLIAIFEVLKIERMTVSEGALREGLLYDVIGRIHHEDIRVKTIADIQTRFNIDPQQSKQVSETTSHLAEQVKKDWQLNKTHLQLLTWAAQLHELGLSISHADYHKHGGYMLEHADLPGFTRKEQHWVAVLTENHRRKMNTDLFEALPEDQQLTVKKLCILLRLSVLLHRSRKFEPVFPQLQVKDKAIYLSCRLLLDRPMLKADLEREQKWVNPIGFELMPVDA